MLFMAWHVTRITGISALLLLCMFIPFLPGRYDSLAVTLSFMTQVFSFGGLLLIPIGAVWLGLEIARRKKGHKLAGVRYVLSVVVIIISAVLVIISTIAAYAGYNHLFGTLFLADCFYMLIRTLLKLPKTNLTENSFNPIPIYLLTIPAILVLARLIFIAPAVAFSRNYVIENGGPLIQAIELYRDKNGHYPVSLQALHADYKPSVIGVYQYHYELNGNAYNVYFKQFSEDLAAEEIVMYNKLGEHAFAAHAADILEYTGEALALRRGDRRKYTLPQLHWVYFRFD
jgi:hypothetical protein